MVPLPTSNYATEHIIAVANDKRLEPFRQFNAAEANINIHIFHIFLRQHIVDWLFVILNSRRPTRGIPMDGDDYTNCHDQ